MSVHLTAIKYHPCQNSPLSLQSLSWWNSQFPVEITNSMLQVSRCTGLYGPFSQAGSEAHRGPAQPRAPWGPFDTYPILLLCSRKFIKKNQTPNYFRLFECLKTITKITLCSVIASSASNSAVLHATWEPNLQQAQLLTDRFRKTYWKCKSD